MRPWIHPQERRSRVYWSLQISVGVAAMIVIPVLLLLQPTADHVVLAMATLLIGALLLLLCIRELRKLRDEYRHADPEEKDAPAGSVDG